MFEEFSHERKTVYLPPGKLQPALTVDSGGFTRENSRAYRWNGVRRGSGGQTVFQYTISGAGLLRYGRKRFLVNPGQAMLVHFPHDHEYSVADLAQGWEFIYIVFSGKEAVRVWKHIERTKGPVIDLPAGGPSLAAASDLLREIFASAPRSSYRSAKTAANFVYTLADELLERHGSDSPFEALKTWCREHLSPNLTVPAMAARAGWSRHHFARRFHEIEGVSPRVFLERCRVEKACQLLGQTRRSIKEIAYDCGFSRPDYFAKAFRRVMKISPLAFRQSRIH